MQYYGHKKFIGHVTVAEEDGILLSQFGEIPYKKGDKIFHPLVGSSELITDDYFEENFTPVKVKKKIDWGENVEEMYKQPWVTGDGDC